MGRSQQLLRPGMYAGHAVPLGLLDAELAEHAPAPSSVTLAAPTARRGSPAAPSPRQAPGTSSLDLRASAAQRSSPPCLGEREDDPDVPTAALT